MRKFLAATLISLAAAGCASFGDGDEGWTGNGAQPFDSAVRECQSQTLSSRGPAFEACMSTKGWTRPER